MSDELYVSRSIKRRRSTKGEVWHRRLALFGLVKGMQPMTVRQAYYQAVVRGLVSKDASGYAQVLHDLIWLRREGSMPYDWIVDNTRQMRKPYTSDSVEEALRETAEYYRKNLWRDADVYVEIWLEKDALSGVVYPITSEFDVPLMTARGFSSLSFTYGAAEQIKARSVPAYIYQLGDYDPSGEGASRALEQDLRELAPDEEIHFERLGVTPDQIREWDLPTRPTNMNDTRAKRFGSSISCDLDAVEPDTLRGLVRDAIERHMPPRQFAILKAAEESERAHILRLVEGMAA
jgi:hypothetical protein